jgi:hypothetical protein
MAKWSSTLAFIPEVTEIVEYNDSERYTNTGSSNTKQSLGFLKTTALVLNTALHLHKPHVPLLKLPAIMGLIKGPN